MARYVIGIDEVGRGPLAGPITVGAVATKGRIDFLRGIKDSKKLSAKQREEWLSKIKEKQLKYRNFEIALASVGVSTIDKIGISASARLAVGRCLKKLKIKNKNHKILLDGSLYAPRTYQNQKTIIKGDEQIPLIAAASIIAKVARDRMMVRLHNRYPRYGFATHKGYGTAIHRAALAQHGF